jgi:hypothetical protein
VDVLNHDLETVEAASFRYLHLSAESLDKVLVDDAIRCSKECENVRDEEALIVVELVVPVGNVLGEINLLSRPERGLRLLVHAPDLHALLDKSTLRVHDASRKTNLMVLDGEEHEALGVLLQQWLVCLLSLDGRRDRHALLWDLDVVWYADDGDGDVGVLLVRGIKGELLGGRVAHLKALNGRRSLSVIAY